MSNRARMKTTPLAWAGLVLLVAIAGCMAKDEVGMLSGGSSEMESDMSSPGPPPGKGTEVDPARGRRAAAC